jgi:hypothetical protein
MPLRKLPETDDERLEALNAIIRQEESVGKGNAVLTTKEFHELRDFLLIFEGSVFCYKQSLDDEIRASQSHFKLFEIVQLYLSHFIQVLYFAVIRNEIKADKLALYELDGKNFNVPDISTEEAVLEWCERIIRGETNRVCNGGQPIYNPAIAKVKVHFDIFKDSLHSIKIYRQNTIRNKEDVIEKREKVDKFIDFTWEKVENKCNYLSADEQEQIYKMYKINFKHNNNKGMQLNVFD